MAYFKFSDQVDDVFRELLRSLSLEQKADLAQKAEYLADELDQKPAALENVMTRAGEVNRTLRSVLAKSDLSANKKETLDEALHNIQLRMTDELVHGMTDHKIDLTKFSNIIHALAQEVK